jgi:uncharacterized membrane protein YdbT with pleckstrin-like domain
MNLDDLKAYALFRPSWRAFAVPLFGAAVFWLGPQVNPDPPLSPALSEFIGTLFLAFVLVKRYTCLYRLGAQEVTAETSFPASRSQSVAIADIRRIDLRQGVIQRLLSVAHVHIYTQEQGGPALKLFGVPHPQVFKKALLEMGAGDQRVTGAWRK